MGIKFFDWMKRTELNKDEMTKRIEIICDAAEELKVRSLCWNICVNMIANAIGRCEFRTFKKNKEVFAEEYYLWNFEPNRNENSSAFLHKLVERLLVNNEALVIEQKRAGGVDLLVADSFTRSIPKPGEEAKYGDVRVGEHTYKKQFKESDVLHFTLNAVDAKPVLDKIAENYGELVGLAKEFIRWTQAHHWKVHVSQIAQGGDAEDWATNFTKMLTEQLKPFLTGAAAVLPEFDGYAYSDVRSDRVYQSANGETATLRNLTDDIFTFTARTLLIPVVLANGEVEATGDANKRFLTQIVDPICDQLQEEITRKRYGFKEWQDGSLLRVDSSEIIHFDLFAEASGVEKLVGSGAFSINEIRRAASRLTITEPWADKHFLTKNITALEEALHALTVQKGGNE